MISVEIILIFLFSHWISDWVCQTRWMGEYKSREILPLITHTGLYTLLWIIPTNIVMNGPKAIILFLIITFITHTIIDYITSREEVKALKEKKMYKCLTILGFDQFLHMVQLFATYYFINIYSYLL